MHIEKSVKKARPIDQLSIKVGEKRFMLEKNFNEKRKEKFEFVKSYEYFDLYKHKKAGYYECFDKR